MDQKIIKEIKSHSRQEKVDFLQKFFRTRKGEYAEGDKLLVVTVPECRMIAKKYINDDFATIKHLLDSEFHEIRFIGLLMLTYKIQRKDTQINEISEFYLENLHAVNNWDLVDLSCYKILGPYLKDKKKDLLYDLAKSGDLWKQRIAIVTTMAFVRNGELDDTYQLAEILMTHKHDLIHKAVGWLLREAGKKDEKRLEKFLDKYRNFMPRTTLRYSIERLSERKRIYYLGKKMKAKQN